jgi:hypothetical protein
MNTIHETTMNKITAQNNTPITPMNNLIKSLNGLIVANDPQVILMGETMMYHLDRYIQEIMEHNLSKDEAIAAMANYCDHCLSILEAGEEIEFPWYRDDLVALIAKFCPDESSLCA